MTRHVWLTLLLIAGSLGYVLPARAELSILELVDSIKRHHPEFSITDAQVAVAKGGQDEANAVFDPTISQRTEARTRGYYNGRVAEQGINKPLGPMNAEVFGRYSLSDGSFPSYEGADETTDQGEVSLGVKLALLQDRAVDARRLEIDNAARRVEQAEFERLLDINFLLFEGISAYLDWFLAGQEILILEGLVALTQENVRAIESRVNSGDLATFDLTEAQAALLTREVALEQAKQKLALAAVKLSYYYRDTAGNMLDLSHITPPTTLAWPFSRELSTEFIEQRLLGHPKLQAVEAKLQQTKNKQRLAINETLPELDLKMELSRDFGDGIEALRGTENKVGIAFSLPLGQRAAKARQRTAEAQIYALELEQQATLDQLRRDLERARIAAKTSEDIFKLSQQQVAVARRLSEQEKKRFDAGTSDLFLLLIRETAAAQAELSMRKAQTDLYQQELAVLAQLAQLFTR